MDNKKWDVYVYGDINIDLVIPGIDQLPLPGQEDVVDTMNTYVGGGAALFTLGLGKLGLMTVFQATVGDDCYGQFIRDEFKNKNVDSTLLSTSESNKTGISISFTNKMDRSFLTYRGTNKEIDLSKVNLDKVKESRHIHLTGYMGSKNHHQFLELMQKVKENQGTTISFDVGWDDTGEWYQEIYELFPYVDILFMNETEAIHYSRKASAEEGIRDFAQTCGMVVAKLGNQGAMAIHKGNTYKAKGYKVEVVDPTGAGDSFNAGFIYGFLNKKTIEDCLKCGNGCGALSVTALGGNTGFPIEHELIQFMQQQER